MAHTDARAHPHPVKGIELNQGRLAMLPGKGIAEPAAQYSHNFAVSKARDRSAAAIAQDTQIIDPVAVIGVFVGPEHRINPADFVVQQLHPQIR